MIRVGIFSISAAIHTSYDRDEIWTRQHRALYSIYACTVRVIMCSPRIRTAEGHPPDNIIEEEEKETDKMYAYMYCRYGLIPICWGLFMYARTFQRNNYNSY